MGGGPCLEDVRVALASAPGNLVVDLPGQVAHADVHASYRAKPCDAFLNVSASEGVPVSVMEALSYGIPVVATAVGGTAELLGHGGGKLLVPNPSAGEIASALFGLTTDGGRLALRRASRQVWADLCRADVNFSRFAGRLRSLLDSPGSALAVP
jgi:glycosyltransferase involved in cell wall biosynthesis